MFLNQKGIVQIISIILLLAGLGAGLYLVSKTQVFRPQAAGKSIEIINNDCLDTSSTTRSLKTGCPKVKFKLTPPTPASSFNFIKSVLAQEDSDQLPVFSGKSYKCSVDNTEILENVFKLPFGSSPVDNLPTIFGVELEFKVPGVNWGYTEEVRANCKDLETTCNSEGENVACVPFGTNPVPDFEPIPSGSFTPSATTPIESGSPTPASVRPSPTPTVPPAAGRLLQQRQGITVTLTPSPTRRLNIDASSVQKKVTGYRFSESPAGLSNKDFLPFNPNCGDSFCGEHTFADPANGPHFIYAQFQYNNGEVINANPYPLTISIGQGIAPTSPPLIAIPTINPSVTVSPSPSASPAISPTVSPTTAPGATAARTTAYFRFTDDLNKFSDTNWGWQDYRSGIEKSHQFSSFGKKYIYVQFKDNQGKLIAHNGAETITLAINLTDSTSVPTTQPSNPGTTFGEHDSDD